MGSGAARAGPRQWGKTTLFVLGALALHGCAASPEDLHADASPPTVRVTLADAGVRDLRQQYRQALCPRLQADGRPCDDVLLQRAADMGTPASKSSGDYAQRYRIVFVPGYFNECFERFWRPFADPERELRQRGYRVDYFGLPGRGTTAGNAERLAAHFAALDDDPRPVILFAYSKGVPDTLEFIVQHPEAARRIAALVAVASAANGSPLADELLPTYRKWLASVPLPDCERGTGDASQDLRRDVRMAWWSRHRDAVTVPVFSLVAAPRPERVSPTTRLLYRSLARIEPRNDGKLLASDQIVPGGYLLGYVNADHSDIVNGVAANVPGAGLLPADDVPRVALVEAAIEVVAGVLLNGSRAAAADSPSGSPRHASPDSLNAPQVGGPPR
jgi:hypothetical protein